jgi:hypothetical protein
MNRSVGGRRKFMKDLALGKEKFVQMRAVRVMNKDFETEESMVKR